MTQSYQIRAGTPADTEVIVEFNLCLAMETEGKALDELTLRAGVEGVFVDPRRGRYFLACHGEQVVGQLMLTKEWSDWRNGDIWWIQSVYVRNEHRRNGVYRRLHQYVVDLAQRTPDVVGVRLYVEFANANAQATYQQMGMERASYHVMETMFAKDSGK